MGRSKRLKILFILMGLMVFVWLLIPLQTPLFLSPKSPILLDRNGDLLDAKIAADEQWRFDNKQPIPQAVKETLVNYEDAYFYYHFGFNPISLIKAFTENLKSKEIIRGGSTLTMQLARMVDGNKKRTYFQKIKEILMAIKIETLYSKEQVLEAYIENAPFGKNIVGIHAASYKYFGRPLDQLSYAEIASLVVIPNNPSNVYPGKNNAVLKKKRDFLLVKLQKQGLITKRELELYLMEPIPLHTYVFPSKARHYLESNVTDSGSSVVESKIEGKHQEAISKLLDSYMRGIENQKIYNAAVVVRRINESENFIHIGNRNGKSIPGSSIDMAFKKRSPGSTLKPLLYRESLHSGLILPSQLLEDSPLYYKGFKPENFDKKFRGMVPADYALTNSLNVPFVNLLDQYGIGVFLEDLQKKYGLTNLDKGENHYGLALILGGCDISLNSMVGAYQNLAKDYFDYLSDTSQDYQAFYSSQKTLNALTKVNRPEEEFGWSYFEGHESIAWKTGTSYGHRDAWSIGVTDEYVIGIWIGNADNSGRSNLTGTRYAAPLLFKIHSYLKSKGEFREEIGNWIDVCTLSGQKSGEHCEETRRELVSGNLNNTPICGYHESIYLNAEGTAQVNSTCYPLENAVVRKWFTVPARSVSYFQRYNTWYKPKPEFIASCSVVDKKEEFEIIYPKHNSKIRIPSNDDGELGGVIFEAKSSSAEKKLFWYIDDQYFGMTQGEHQMDIQLPSGSYKLSLIDSNGENRLVNFQIYSDF